MSAVIEDTQAQDLMNDQDSMNSQGMNAQGVVHKPDFTNPIAIKMDSAKKMSLADKTGNEALKREAAAEQSFADRMGGRSALSKKKQADGSTSPQSTSPRALGMLKSASQPVLAQSKPTQQSGMVKSQSSFKVSFPQTPAEVPDEAIALKMDAAMKQSLADRTGDIRLKQAAAAEQSLADKLGATAASRLNITAFKRLTISEDSAAPVVHVPLPIPTAAAPVTTPSTSPTFASQMLHTCSCCGHQEPFNGGNGNVNANASGTRERSDSSGSKDVRFYPIGREKKEATSSSKTIATDSDGKWLRGQKIPSREELAQKGKSTAAAAAAATTTPSRGGSKKDDEVVVKRADSPKARKATQSAPASASTSPTITIEQPSELQLKPRKVTKKNKNHSRQQSLDSNISASSTETDASMMTKQTSSIPEPVLLTPGDMRM